MALVDTQFATRSVEHAAAESAAPSPASKRLAGAARLKGLLVPLVLLALWQGLSARGVFEPHLVPAPVDVFEEIRRLVATGELWTHLAATGQRVGLGFLVGSLAALVLGTATGASRGLRELLDPTLQALKAVPSLAWVPLFILWFGIFETSKVTLIAVGAFFPVYLNLASAIQGTDRKLVEVARVNRLGPWRTIRHVLVPATLPAFVVGLRGGLALGWMFVIAAELMGASEGLGFLMVDGQMTGRPAVIVASLLLFAVAGKVSDAALALAARPYLAWQDSLASIERGGTHA